MLEVLGQTASKKVKNILSSIQWVALTAIAGAFGLLATDAEWYWKGAAFGTAVAICGTYLWAFIYFALKDPNRLQTEEYNIRTRELDLQSKSGIATTTSVDRLIEQPPIIDQPVRPTAKEGE